MTLACSWQISAGSALVSFTVGSSLDFLTVAPSPLILQVVQGEDDQGDPLPQPAATLNITNTSGGAATSIPWNL